MARRSDSANLPRVYRCDRIDVGQALQSPRRTAEGYILADGYIAKPGVLVYQRPDGGVTRELVTADELRRADSLATLGEKPLTLEHPDADVSPETVAEVGVGNVGADLVAYDDGYVRVKLAIRRADAIRSFESGATVELSPGYTCDIDPTPGVDPVFGRYDAIQRNRQYNHLALCGRARGGPTIRARADSADVAIQIPSLSESPVKLLSLSAPILVRLGALAGKPVRLDADGTPDLASASEALASLEASAPATAEAMALVEKMKKDIEVLKATMAAKEAELAALTGAPSPSPAAVESEMEMAAEGDPMLDAAGAPVAPPADMPKDPAAASPIRQDAIRRAVARIGAERAQLEAMAASCRLDSAAVAKMGLRSLRKAVLKVAAPHARQDGTRDYDRASIDHLAAGRRTDSAGSDAFRGFFDGDKAGANRQDAVQHEDAAPPSPISDAYNRRWKLGAYAPSKV